MNRDEIIERLDRALWATQVRPCAWDEIHPDVRVRRLCSMGVFLDHVEAQGLVVMAAGAPPPLPTMQRELFG